jgi:hypothetical protein
MVGRASKTVWTLRRMKKLGVDQATLVQFWMSEGRVHLEMAAPVWHSSLTLAQSRSLSRVQRVAMAALTGSWDRSHSGQLRRLGLEPLPERRAKLCRRFAHRTATKSRHRDLFQIAEYTQPGRRGKPRPLYREPRARTTLYRRSAVPYLTRLLNVGQ